VKGLKQRISGWKMALAPEKRLQMKESTTKKKGSENKFS
jgi:hypothetical protein